VAVLAAVVIGALLPALLRHPGRQRTDRRGNTIGKRAKIGSMSASVPRLRNVEERERRVSSVELFFDLVFVFAFTQVTTFWLEHTSWGGLGRGLLVLLVLWWVWASYAWLTNAADVEAGVVSTVLLFAMGALFIAALSVPDAYGKHRLLFALALLVVLAAFVGLYALVSKDVPDQLAAVLRMSRTVVLGGALIVAAAFAPASVRPVLWALAFVVGFFGPLLGGLGGWRVQPAHFAERHGLIVIIALGESLGAIGFGARTTELTLRVIVGAVLGLLIAASLWLAYFDYVSVAVRDLLAERRGEQRIAVARDAYSYAHLPMVTGIILLAFAMRTTLAHTGMELKLIPALAVCCGCALYLLGFVWLRWRLTKRLGIGRPTAAVAFVLLIPAATSLPALAAVGLVAAVWIGLHLYELLWWREERAQRRASGAGDAALDV
jgi:low temperature requirement protein LtrA